MVSEGLNAADTSTPGPIGLDGADWLREEIKRGGPLIWSGYGLSLAVAEVLAAVSRELGAVSYAINPADLGIERTAGVAYLSRSGRDPGRPVDLLVTEAREQGSRAGPYAARILLIEDPDEGSDPWLPTRYARATVHGVACSLGLEPVSVGLPPGPEVGTGDGCLLLFEAHSRVVRSTLRAVREKIGVSPCEAMSFAELGHGFHGQLWARPEDHCVWILRSCGAAEGPELAIRAWCGEVGVPVHDLALLESHGGALGVIELFERTLDIFERFALRNGLPLHNAPIPAQLDRLRFA
jgi:hypothetical protein